MSSEEEELPLYHEYIPYVITQEDLDRTDLLSKGIEDEPLTEAEYCEFMISGFSKHEDIFYSGALARLYWNLEHYPIPNGVNLDSMYDNMKLALHRLGIHGRLQIYAYADQDPHLQLDGVKYNFTQRQGDEKSIAGQMSRDILDFVFTDIVFRPFILVLSDDYPELLRVLHSLYSRVLPKVLRMTPQPGGPHFFESAESVYDCTRYLYGGRKPPDSRVNSKTPQSELLINMIKNASSIPFFVVRVSDSGSKTVVLWDEGDCPFLSQDSNNHKDLLQKIDSALRDNWAIPGEILVTVYLDEGKEYGGLLTRKRTREDSVVPIEYESEIIVDGEKSKSIIDFYPAGNKTARLERMLNDIYLWAIDNDYSQCYQSNVIILANGVREDKKFRALKRLSGAGYSVYLVTPSSKDTRLERPDWPGFLFDDACMLSRF